MERNGYITLFVNFYESYNVFKLILFKNCIKEHEMKRQGNFQPNPLIHPNLLCDPVDKALWPLFTPESVGYMFMSLSKLYDLSLYL